ncbi:MAG TPA: S41 family peptidase [Gemmatimonadales bacterium]|jgi:carboxyl-terminal processing protease
MNPRRIVLVSSIAVVSFVSGGWLLQRPEQQGDGNVYQRARLFDDILSTVAEYYVDTLPETKLYDLAIEGMMDQINDPYTAYLKKDARDDLTLTVTGNYAGIGAQIDSRDNYITVVTPLPDTPGERAGIVAGDLIVGVDTESTAGWSVDQATHHMRGVAGTHVKLRIMRAGVRDTIRLDITRAPIHVNAVEGGTLLTPTIAYVKLNQVSDQATAELAASIDSLRLAGAKSLVFDLRGNTGGILQEGVTLGNLFVDAPKVIVETRGRAPGESEMFRATRPARWPGMPIVVLVNEFTASSAEILSGALQDHDRGLILGTQTFGKGVAYQVFNLSNTEAVSVTTSRWYTPSGRTIDRGHVRHQLLRQDTTGKEQDSSVFRTDMGRKLKGGGGIQPDVLLAPDTLTTAEQKMAKALGSKVPDFRNALAAYALDLKTAGTVTQRDFTVTNAMITELLTRLRARGITMPDSLWYPAKGIISQQLGYDIARYVYGRAAELKRRNQEDNQVRRAVQLLQGARTMAELLRVPGPGDK